MHILKANIHACIYTHSKQTRMHIHMRTYNVLHQRASRSRRKKSGQSLIEMPKNEFAILSVERRWRLQKKKSFIFLPTKAARKCVLVCLTSTCVICVCVCLWNKCLCLTRVWWVIISLSSFEHVFMECVCVRKGLCSCLHTLTIVVKGDVLCVACASGLARVYVCMTISP